jgi:hypothetical protein
LDLTQLVLTLGNILLGWWTDDMVHLVDCIISRVGPSFSKVGHLIVELKKEAVSNHGISFLMLPNSSNKVSREERL